MRIVLTTFCFASLCLAGDWLTFGGDPQRTGLAQGEETITLKNVGKMRLEW